MKKDLYNSIITIAPEHELAGILSVAAYDLDVTPEEFLELAELVDTKKRNARK